MMKYHNHRRSPRSLPSVRCHRMCSLPTMDTGWISNDGGCFNSPESRDLVSQPYYSEAQTAIGAAAVATDWSARRLRPTRRTSFARPERRADTTASARIRFWLGASAPTSPTANSSNAWKSACASTASAHRKNEFSPPAPMVWFASLPSTCRRWAHGPRPPRAKWPSTAAATCGSSIPPTVSCVDFVEDDGYTKNVLYRWRPEDTPSRDDQRGLPL